MQAEFDDQERARRRADMKRQLEQSFGIRAAYASIPQLAQVLGMAQSTIYGHIQRGEFFIPHRRLGKALAVAVDDFLDWHCASEPASAAPAADRAPPKPQERATPLGPNPRAMVAETLAELGIDRSACASRSRRRP